MIIQWHRWWTRWAGRPVQAGAPPTRITLSRFPALLWIVLLSLAPAGMLPAAPDRSLSVEDIRDKIQGAWVGQMAGVCWGEPTEFNFNNVPLPEDKMPVWVPALINRGFEQDDVYVEIPFLDAMKQHGVNCSWERFGEAFRDTRFSLWHANEQGRRNLSNQISAPFSGHPVHNPEYDDIDFMIEADFAGIVAPGLPTAAADIAWRAGHVMNWGNGVYGGVMVAAMHAEAYTARNVREIVEAGRRVIPSGTRFRTMIDEAITRVDAGHTWEENWAFFTHKYRRTSKSFAGDPKEHGASDCDFIDVTQNAAYLLLGLLHGNGDFQRSTELAMRGGCDSDCNPATVGGILGGYLGFKRIPDKFKSALDYQRKFSFTSHSIGDCIALSEKLARSVVTLHGGTIRGKGTAEVWTIPDAGPPLPVPFEQCQVRNQNSLQPIANSAPKVSATLKRLKNRTAKFSASASDSDGVRDYVWFFGDLHYARGAKVTHTYNAPGRYEATCYVTDRRGYTAWQTVTVQVKEPASKLIADRTVSDGLRPLIQ